MQANTDFNLISDLTHDDLTFEKLKEVPDFKYDNISNDAFNNITNDPKIKLQIYNMYINNGIFLKVLDKNDKEKVNKYKPLIKKQQPTTQNNPVTYVITKFGSKLLDLIKLIRRNSQQHPPNPNTQQQQPPQQPPQPSNTQQQQQSTNNDNVGYLVNKIRNAGIYFSPPTDEDLEKEAIKSINNIFTELSKNDIIDKTLHPNSNVLDEVSNKCLGIKNKVAIVEQNAQAQIDTVSDLINNIELLEQSISLSKKFIENNVLQNN